MKIKPAGWLVVGVVVLLLAVLLVAAGRVFWGLLGIRALPQPDVITPTRAVGEVPSPTPLPWAPRMRQVGPDAWMVPPEVEKRVVRDYLDVVLYQMPPNPNFDLEVRRKEAGEYLTGIALEQQMRFYDRVQATCSLTVTKAVTEPGYPLLYSTITTDTLPLVSVQSCLQDGSECILQVEWAGYEPAAIYDYCTGRWLGQGHAPSVVMLVRVRYVAGRWKLAEVLKLEEKPNPFQFRYATPTPSPTPGLMPLATLTP